MRKYLTTLAIATTIAPIAQADSANEKRPNILFCLADDVSFPYFGAYGTPWVRTPNCDAAARQGLLFNNAYTANAKSGPSRSMIITGRYSWQLDQACNHFAYFPEKYKTVVEELADNGYHVGSTGKGWAPGDPGMRGRQPRQLVGKPYNEIKRTPPTKEISDVDYAANFDQFLDRRTGDEPFFFWFGSLEPHRGYVYGTGASVGGYSPSEVDRIPLYWRDCDSTRHDMLDFALELEHFDSHVGMMIESLRRRGELENTIIIITADNGMPFPRIKGQAYHSSNHLPFIVMWGNKIANPGSEVNEYISFVDLCPTFLELAEVTESEMQPRSGSSLVGLIKGEQRKKDQTRTYAILGKERHDIGRPNDEGYPIRAIINDDFLYIHNFEPSRWPAGNPSTGYLNCDAGAIKSLILAEHDTQPYYWSLNFGKRPQEELYNMRTDRDCIHNLATNAAYADTMQHLKHQLFEQLRRDNDPRMFGKGEIFDHYQYSDSKYRNYYNRLEQGEEIPTPSWIIKSDEQRDSE